MEGIEGTTVMLLVVHDGSGAAVGGLPLPVTRSVAIRLPCTISDFTTEPAMKGNECPLLSAQLELIGVDCGHDVAGIAVVGAAVDDGIAVVGAAVDDGIAVVGAAVDDGIAVIGAAVDDGIAVVGAAVDNEIAVVGIGVITAGKIVV